MAPSENHLQALDQLQKEINITVSTMSSNMPISLILTIFQLENVGRLFAAASKGSRPNVAAQASRLKRRFPSSIDSFHDALDQLEDGLVGHNH
jgi:hypothetical protein